MHVRWQQPTPPTAPTTPTVNPKSYTNICTTFVNANTNTTHSKYIANRLDATDPSKPHAPVGHSVVLALMVVELGLAFAVGVGCLVTSILMMRKLRSERDAPLLFPQRRQAERQSSAVQRQEEHQERQQQQQQERLLSDDAEAPVDQLMPDTEAPMGIVGFVASSVTLIPGLRWLRRGRGASAAGGAYAPS